MDSLFLYFGCLVGCFSCVWFAKFGFLLWVWFVSGLLCCRWAGRYSYKQWKAMGKVKMKISASLAISGGMCLFCYSRFCVFCVFCVLFFFWLDHLGFAFDGFWSDVFSFAETIAGQSRDHWEYWKNDATRRKRRNRKRLLLHRIINSFAGVFIHCSVLYPWTVRRLFASIPYHIPPCLFHGIQCPWIAHRQRDVMCIRFWKSIIEATVPLSWWPLWFVRDIRVSVWWVCTFVYDRGRIKFLSIEGNILC